MNSISGCWRSCCPSAFFLRLSNLTQWGIFFYNSLMFVILCTRIVSISCQLPLELIPWTIRMRFAAVLALGQEFEGARCIQAQTGTACLAWYLHRGRVNLVLSFFHQRRDLSVTLAHAKYLN